MDEIDVPAIFDALEEEIKIGRCSVNTVQTRVSHIWGYIKANAPNSYKEAIERKKKLTKININLAKVVTELSQDHENQIAEASRAVAVDPTPKNIQKLLVLVFIFAFPLSPRALCELTYRDFYMGAVTIKKFPHVIAEVFRLIEDAGSILTGIIPPTRHQRVLEINMTALQKKIQRLFVHANKMRMIEAKSAAFTLGHGTRVLPIKPARMRLAEECLKLRVLLTQQSEDRICRDLKKRKLAET
jgi:hypothetical protein